jgi:penicillin-binding protein 2
MRTDRAQLRAERTAAGEYDPDMKDEITGAAIVVVNVKTGEPLAIASWPTFDVSTIIEKYSELLATPNAPLFNRALMGAYAPGSTFKPCVAIACLTEGIINTEFKVKCEGVFTRYAAEGYAPECWIWRASSNPNEHWTHGEDNVTAALRDSCNFFFYTIGHELGIDPMGEYAHAFGLGVPTGIELVETYGNMSNAANHSDYTGTTWRIGDTLQAAIGQSDSIFSPLQIAEYCATVANGGYRHSASVLKAIRSYDYSEVLYEREAEVLSIVQSDAWNWDAVHEGMHLVLHDWSVNGANAEWWADCAWDVAGKTGTAQKGEHITNDGIFMCYAPFNDPEVAIAVVVERGLSGASTQFMARQVMDAYINIKSYKDTSEQEMGMLK